MRRRRRSSAPWASSWAANARAWRAAAKNSAAASAAMPSHHLTYALKRRMPPFFIAMTVTVLAACVHYRQRMRKTRLFTTTIYTTLLCYRANSRTHHCSSHARRTRHCASTARLPTPALRCATRYRAATLLQTLRTVRAKISPTRACSASAISYRARAHCNNPLPSTVVTFAFCNTRTENDVRRYAHRVRAP